MKHRQFKSIEVFNFKGLKIKELTPEGLESASIALIEVPPGEKHPRARSIRCDKVYIGMEGAVSFRVQDRDFRLTSQEILFIPKKEWFQYNNESNKPACILLLHIPPFDIECEEFIDEEQQDNGKSQR